MTDSRWILLDTETSGLHAPIYALELGAQLMHGWKPEGPPFRRLLNHNQDLSPECSRVNGYTREILERDGEPPRAVYAAFADYVQGLPLVSYNLSYDLDQVLQPEWKRLSISPIGSAGFCALSLAQRLLDPVPAGNCKLQTLRQYYRLPERGAHTALGDVNTVIDLMEQVLRPLAERRGIKNWGDIVEFTSTTWFSVRIAFGKFKGRYFTEAREDTELFSWLKWLARSKHSRSAAMGNWYLSQLESMLSSTGATDFLTAPTGSELTIYINPELEALRQLIESARTRLAELEAEYTREHHEVENLQASLFRLMRVHYQRRDKLRLLVRYRRVFIETLMRRGEEEAVAVTEQFEEASESCDQDYEYAAQQVADRKELSEEQQAEIKLLWRKLVRLFHPDRHIHDSEKQAIYTYLTSEINLAREKGDIERLREIADSPNKFLMLHGRGSLDFDDSNQLNTLRRLYEGLQTQILELIENLDELRGSGEYELCRLNNLRPGFISEVADQSTREIEEEIAELESEAARLTEEIETLTGTTTF